MFWLILGIIVGVAVLWWILYGVTEEFQDVEFFTIFMGSLLGLLVGAVVWAGVFVGGNAIVYGAMNPSYRQSQENLVSLADGSAIHGQFGGNLFVSYGYVNQDNVYEYYESLGNNTFDRKQIPADATQIHYIPAGQTPYVVEHHEKQRSKWFASITFQGWEYFDLYVPQGSIAPGINLDNSNGS